MIRRDFFKTPLAVAGLTLGGTSGRRPRRELAKAPGLTRYVSEFIVQHEVRGHSRGRPRPRQEDAARWLRPGAGGIGIGLGAARPAIHCVARLGQRESRQHHRHDDEGAARVSRRSPTASRSTPTTTTTPARRCTSRRPALPPAFALCETERRSGKDLMLAFHVGVEVENKIGDAISPRHDRRRVSHDGNLRLVRQRRRVREASRTRRARRRRTRSASRRRRPAAFDDNFGSMTKAFHAGHAAESGTAAADLAALGWTAADDVLEAPLGFFQAAGGGFDRARSSIASAGRGCSPRQAI